MAHTARTFDVEIIQSLRASELVVLTDEEAEAADEEGYLGGNQYYQDLRGWSWPDVQRLLAVEKKLIDAFLAASEPAFAEQDFNERRDSAEDPIGGLLGLDVGVAGAAAALSAMGAVPFISCNAGSFGGTHPAKFPYVCFYLCDASISLLLELAEITRVGLDGADGVARLYARSVLDLQAFAWRAVERHR